MNAVEGGGDRPCEDAHVGSYRLHPPWGRCRSNGERGAGCGERALAGGRCELLSTTVVCTATPKRQSDRPLSALTLHPHRFMYSVHKEAEMNTPGACRASRAPTSACFESYRLPFICSISSQLLMIGGTGGLASAPAPEAKSKGLRGDDAPPSPPSAGTCTCTIERMPPIDQNSRSWVPRQYSACNADLSFSDAAGSGPKSSLPYRTSQVCKFAGMQKDRRPWKPWSVLREAYTVPSSAPKSHCASLISFNQHTANIRRANSPSTTIASVCRNKDYLHFCASDTRIVTGVTSIISTLSLPCLCLRCLSIKSCIISDCCGVCCVAYLYLRIVRVPWPLISSVLAATHMPRLGERLDACLLLRSASVARACMRPEARA